MNERFYENLTNFIFVEDKPEPSDVIFVPGNGYPQPGEEAARLWREGFGRWILPSGRYAVHVGHFMGVQSSQEKYDKDYGTEWEFIRDVLRINGVPEDVILREDRATFTYENAINSRKVTDAAGISVRKAIICCNTTHARRCLMYYQLLYPKTEFYVCPVVADGTDRYNWYKSEKGISKVLGEVQRCGEQFETIIREMSV
ncbi:MAG: YdcF family protein [Lachnospiraceae bacterium]|nr:YdcF family protein [Lachnospiraceae bacterium]